MSQIILDDIETAKVNGLRSSVKVCDSAGNLIGYLLSKEKYEKLVYGWAKSQVSDEQLRRVAQETEEYSLQEILDGLPKS